MDGVVRRDRSREVLITEEKHHHLFDPGKTETNGEEERISRPNASSQREKSRKSRDTVLSFVLSRW